MEIEITWYKESMRSQVIALFESQYKTPPGIFSNMFEKFYFHPYQKNNCLLIVAIDGETVAGFQSFFHWPYVLHGQSFNSFQSGNSLVHPQYRGKGIFQKMLAFIDKEKKTLGIDFLMGFPVEASLKNFLKDNWKNILNLDWFLKICNPFGFMPNNILRASNLKSGIHYYHENDIKPSPLIRICHNESFNLWRKNFIQEDLKYYTYQYNRDMFSVIFHLKKNKRKKFFNEVIIGNVLFKDESSRLILMEGLKQMLSDLRSSFSVHFISCAINTKSNFNIETILYKNDFKKINKSIYFIVKPFNNESILTDPSSWELYRSDIDTW